VARLRAAWLSLDSGSDRCQQWSNSARNVADDPDAAPILSEAETASAIARAVRKRLGISQAEFSARYHVPIGTLRDWEQNSLSFRVRGRLLGLNCFTKVGFET
jgi:hypothetical protein